MRYIELNNGYKIPEIGFGTFPQKETLIATIPIAIRNGYKLIDSSDNYGNEEFIRADSEIIITKFSQPLRTYELEKCFDESVKKLGHVDIYLLHWPYPYLWKTQWRMMEELYLNGKVKAIGVCNFDLGYMKELLRFCRVKPAINQFEHHPIFQQQELVEYCQNNGVQVMAYSPVARMDNDLHSSNILEALSEKYTKSISQIILRWDIDTGCIPIPASKSEKHISENISVSDFHLTQDEIVEINRLEQGKRIRYNPRTRFDETEKSSFLKYRIENIIKSVVGDKGARIFSVYYRITMVKLKNLVKTTIKLFNRNRKRVILIDNFGFLNRGDQLMIQSVLDQIRKYNPKAIVCFREDVFMQNPSYCMHNNIRSMMMQNEGWKHSRIYAVIVNFVLGKKWIIHPQDIDIVLDCCGYYITDAWHKDELAYNHVKTFYDSFTKSNLKVIYLPQAFGPFRNEWSIKVLEAAYARATKIYAREPVSFNYIEQYVGDTSKVSIAPDFTCLFHPTNSVKIKLPAKQYVLLIANARMMDQTDSIVTSGYMDFLVAVVQKLQKIRRQVYLLNHEGLEDEDILQQLNEKLDVKLPILTNLSCADIKYVIRDAELLISSRYHGVVSGLTQGVPTLCTSWSHKYLELLKEHQCEDNILDVNNISASVNTIEDALINPTKYKSKSGCQANMEAKVNAMWKEVFELIQ